MTTLQKQFREWLNKLVTTLPNEGDLSWFDSIILDDIYSIGYDEDSDQLCFVNMETEEHRQSTDISDLDKWHNELLLNAKNREEN